MEKPGSPDRPFPHAQRPCFGMKRSLDKALPCKQRVSDPDRDGAAAPDKPDPLVVRCLREIRACERAISETDERVIDGSFKYRMLIALRSALDQHRTALANLKP